MAQSESSPQTAVGTDAPVEMIGWVGTLIHGPADRAGIAAHRPRLSEERITQLIWSLRQRAIYPDLRAAKRVTRMERMRRLLVDWRAADRRLGLASESSADVARLQADVEGLRNEYHRLFAERVGTPPGA